MYVRRERLYNRLYTRIITYCINSTTASRGVSNFDADVVFNVHTGPPFYPAMTPAGTTYCKYQTNVRNVESQSNNTRSVIVRGSLQRSAARHLRIRRPRLASRFPHVAKLRLTLGRIA